MPSPDQREYAARLLRKAEEDLAVVRAFDRQRVDRRVAARWLTPWAAEFRYDEPEIAGFDRAESLTSAERAIEWARGVVDGAA